MTDDIDLNIKHLDRALDELNLAPDPDTLKAAESLERPGPRRAGAKKAAAQMTKIRVVDIGSGALSLEERPLTAVSPKRRGRPRVVTGRAQIKAERPMSILPYNKVTAAVAALDKKLTPDRGLREWKNGKIVGDGTDIKPLGKGKKVLLFVHGTFSKSDAYFDQIDRRGFKAGDEFLRWANKHYDQILTYDHATLSKSPFVNAHRLALAMGDTNADVDVISHSRGGVVTRWWVEALDRGRGQRRVVFAASPLAGTGLASPANIRGAMDMAYNIGNAITKVSAAVPMLMFATGLFQIVTSVLRVAGKTPLADAVVAIVPGLAGQSRVGNNYELLSLRSYANPHAARDYFFVVSNFESEKAGWKFWKVFRKGKLKMKLADIGTDTLFDGKNDLVVDTLSMTNLKDGLAIPDSQILDFDTQDKVFHTNYFEQARTLEFIRQSFERGR
ncbi:MAG: hypothetical protein PVI97_13125 [Candidatus Thiodiazotropha sp.]|jgi:pimeloyl-ACP methyl ester carboxylesterase